MISSATKNTISTTCSFADSISTDAKADAPTYLVNSALKQNSIEIEELLSWEDFDLRFFATEKFDDEITSDLETGAHVFMETKWNKEQFFLRILFNMGSLRIIVCRLMIFNRRLILVATMVELYDTATLFISFPTYTILRVYHSFE